MNRLRPVLLSIFTLLGLIASKANATLLIGNSGSNNIVVFDESTGTFQGDFTTPGLGGLRSPDDLTIGPDGNLYVSSGGDSGLNLFDTAYPQDSAVLRYSLTGEFLGVAASGGGLTRPYGNAFAPDGSLFVSSFRTNQILRYDGTTGAFLSVFASDHNGGLGTRDGLDGPQDLLFAPDGSLYVTVRGTANDAKGNLGFFFENQVLRYSPEQVAGLAPTTTPSVFISKRNSLKPPESPLDLYIFNYVLSRTYATFLGLALAPTGDSIYVSSVAGNITTSNAIHEYDLAGNLLNVIPGSYIGTRYSEGLIASLTFGAGASSNNLYATIFDPYVPNPYSPDVDSVLAYSDAQGSAGGFSGSLFTSSSLERPIGIVATAGVPEPSTVAGLLLGLGGLGVARLRQRRSHKL